MNVTEPATSAQTAYDSVSPAAARARFMAFAGADGEAFLVSEATPIPTTAIGPGADTVIQFEDELGDPVSVSAEDRLPVAISGSATVSGTVTTASPVVVGTTGTTFTSTSSATLLAANSSRKAASIYVNSGSGDLHVLIGSGTASATVKSLTIAAGGYYELIPGCQQVITAIFASAGSAYVTEYV